MSDLAVRIESKVVLITDLVDSVRLMHSDEAGVIERWLLFLANAQCNVVTAHQGRIVRSTGDGLIVVFGTATQAIRASLALHQALHDSNQLHPTRERMCLRTGVHATDFFERNGDIFGDGVNLAARLMSLAGPCETVISESVRESLSDGLDFELDDLGECYLKNMAEPVRAYRAGPPGHEPLVTARADYLPVLSPTIAVIPFEARQLDSQLAIGELIADGIIARLSHDRHLRVISRLSTTPFRGRPLTTTREIQSHLGATYVLTGSYGTLGDRLLVHYEVCDVRSQQVLDSGRVTDRVSDLLEADSQVIDEIVAKTSDAIFREALKRVHLQPLPTLESYSLLLGAVQLLHRSTPAGFERSYKILEFLAEKHPRAVEPRLWLAKWHTLRAIQDAQVDRPAYARAALMCTRRALDTDPTNAFALAMAGFVHCHLTMDYDAAMECLQQSIESNRSETLGHLFHGLMQGLTGDFVGGIQSYQEASLLSPLDPDSYIIDSVGSYLHLGAARFPQAAELAKRSLRRNRLHAHSWRALTIAQAEMGLMDDAKLSLKQVQTLQPGLTVAGYIAAARPGDSTRHRFADCLRDAGLPDE